MEVRDAHKRGTSKLERIKANCKAIASLILNSVNPPPKGIISIQNANGDGVCYISGKYVLDEQHICTW